jgi:ketosteroid isomerase-like protein
MSGRASVPTLSSLARIPARGGPCPPTGKSVRTDYVYVMEFEGEKIRHMTKIWHAGLAMKELGWI